jgi:hypothetical protein
MFGVKQYAPIHYSCQVFQNASYLTVILQYFGLIHPAWRGLFLVYRLGGADKNITLLGNVTFGVPVM